MIVFQQHGLSTCLLSFSTLYHLRAIYSPKQLKIKWTRIFKLRQKNMSAKFENTLAFKQVSMIFKLHYPKWYIIVLLKLVLHCTPLNSLRFNNLTFTDNSHVADRSPSNFMIFCEFSTFNNLNKVFFMYDLRVNCTALI